MVRKPSPERTERSRRAILDAALPVFARDGYKAASLNAIIAASGLTKGGFYFHFPSKLDLALAVVADHQQRWVAEVRAEIAGRHTAVERLFEAPLAIARLAERGAGPTTLRVLVDELCQDPDLRERASASLRLWIDTATEHFAAAQAEGSLRADLDPRVMAEIAVGGFMGLLALSEQLGDGGLRPRVEALVHTLRLATLVPPPDAGRPTPTGTAPRPMTDGA